MNLKNRKSLIYKIPLILFYGLSLFLLLCTPIGSLELSTRNIILAIIFFSLSIAILITAIREFICEKYKSEGVMYLIGGLFTLIISIICVMAI